MVITDRLLVTGDLVCLSFDRIRLSFLVFLWYVTWDHLVSEPPTSGARLWQCGNRWFVPRLIWNVFLFQVFGDPGITRLDVKQKRHQSHIIKTAMITWANALHKTPAGEWKRSHLCFSTASQGFYLLFFFHLQSAHRAALFFFFKNLSILSHTV